MKTTRLVFRLIEVAAKACRKQLDKQLDQPNVFMTIYARPVPHRPYLLGGPLSAETHYQA